jgi:hypothetical protein
MFPDFRREPGQSASTQFRTMPPFWGKLFEADKPGVLPEMPGSGSSEHDLRGAAGHTALNAPDPSHVLERRFASGSSSPRQVEGRRSGGSVALHPLSGLDEKAD